MKISAKIIIVYRCVCVQPTAAVFTMVIAAVFAMTIALCFNPFAADPV